MPHNLSETLADVVWIGGSACAGKTSTAARLAAEYGLAVYSCDERFRDHQERADPDRHRRFLGLANRSPRELWTQPPAAQAEELLGFYAEEFEMVVDDLRALGAGAVVAEGVGLLPALVAALGVDLRRALWLVATPEFIHQHYPLRGPWVRRMLRQRVDPERAWNHWMERDARVARAVAAEARRFGGRVLTVDGRHTFAETAAEAARLLGLHREAP